MNAAAIADAAVGRPVLVVGSPPPGGRDLDLLVRPEEEAAIAAALRADGFSVRGSTWARFCGGTADVVDLIPAAEWGGEVLFDEAVPLDGFEHLVVPAPHHEVLLAAARFVSPSGRMKEGRTRRVAAAVQRDPSALARARAEARAWGAEAGLERLQALLDGSPRRDVRATVRVLPARVLGRRGVVVALSGIDGSGTTTQAKALVEALDRLGHEAVIARGPLAGDAWLDAIARRIDQVLRLLPARRHAPTPGGGHVPGVILNAGGAPYDRSATVAQGWATLVALGTGVQHARRSARHVAAGRVVVFDRYELDAMALLRFVYGEQRRFRAQRLLIRALSPRPAAAFHLDIDPAGSLGRKDDKWSAEELATQVRLYREERDALGVAALDGTGQADEVAAEIAERVWRVLD